MFRNSLDKISDIQTDRQMNGHNSNYKHSHLRETLPFDKFQPVVEEIKRKHKKADTTSEGHQFVRLAQ